MKDLTIGVKRLLFFSLAVLAYEASAATNKQAVHYSKEAFNEGVARLPVGYRGNSIVETYRQRAVAPKGEFETTEEYKARVASIHAGTFAFVIENPYIKYDADTGAFDVEVLKAPINTGLTLDGSAVWLKEELTPQGKYVGVNAFGVSATITKERVDVYSLSLRDEVDGEWMHAVRLSLPMAAERASRLKSRLRVFLICEMTHGDTPALMSQDWSRGATGYLELTPTIDNPTRRDTFFFTMSARLLGWWVFDVNSGEVLGRFLPSGIQVSL